MTIREYLFEKDPYDGLDATGHVFDTKPFNMPYSVLNVVSNLRPSMILEIGSWRGASAIYMADQLRHYNINGHIVCIDTWLGSKEMWLKPFRDLWNRYSGLNIQHGMPTIYPDFIKNVIVSGHADRITPFPATSQIAARVLQHLNVKADLVYIDGSHDYEDVMNDLESFWPLVSNRGVIIGDDFNEYWRVRDAVSEFAEKVEKPYEVHEDGGWLLHKTTIQKALYG